MTSPLLEVKGLWKSYGEVQALRGVDCTVYDGEFLSIIGPSGSGKSTLLKILAGVEPATGGCVLYRGKDISLGGRETRDIVMVWQSLALFPHMNVARNVEFGLRVRRIVKSQREEMVEKALIKLGLQAHRARGIDELSGGERQRVALARALVVEPKVLLLDEPFGALDAHLRAGLQGQLRQLQEHAGLTFIMVTHDQGEAIALSNRIAVINRGGIEQVGTPTDISERPLTAFVARFVGEKNIMDGIVTSVQNEKCVVETKIGRFTAIRDSHGDSQLAVGTAAVYVVDGNLMRLGRDLENQVQGKVISKVSHGRFRIIRLEIGEGQTVVWECLEGEDKQLDAGSIVDLCWRPTDARVIDELLP